MKQIEAMPNGQRLVDADKFDQVSSAVNKLDVRTITSAAYTLKVTDLVNTYLVFTATDVDFTIPPASSVPAPVGTTVGFEMAGSGTLTIIEGSGVTVNKRTTLESAGQYAVMGITNKSFNRWTAFGDLAAS